MNTQKYVIYLAYDCFVASEEGDTGTLSQALVFDDAFRAWAVATRFLYSDVITLEGAQSLVGCSTG